MGAVDKIRAALQVALPNLAVSSGSIEQKIIDVVGTYADSEAIERENTLTVINKALAEQKITSIEYYRRKAIEYEPNSEIVFDPVNQGAIYPNPDPSKRLVVQACVVEDFPRYTIRVNKIDSATRKLAPLTESEKSGFETYFRYFQPLGLTLAVQSLPVAEITDPELTVYITSGYDADAVASAINESFIAAESVLRPTNRVTVSELADLIQSVEGVRAVAFSSELSAEDTDKYGNRYTVVPQKGVFNLTTNAFSFTTQVTADMLKVLE